MAQLHLGLGQLYLGQQQFQNALKAFHAGIYSLAQSEGQPSSLLDNPPLEQMHTQRLLLQLIAGKADALVALYQISPEPSLLDAAWQTSRLATRYMEQLRSGYSAETDKALLLEDSYPVFERAIGIAVVYLELTHAEQWIDTAFVLMEESKALNLRDAILHGEARRYAGIPDSLLQQEHSLRLEIAGREKLIRTYRTSSFYDRAIEFSYMNDLAASRDKFRRLIARYEREHPQYYALKHKPISGSIDQLRASLYSHQTLLEYFVGDSTTFLLVVNAGSQNLFRRPHGNELQSLVSKHRSSIIDFAHDKSQHALVNYSESATRLYQLLIPSDLLLDSALLIVPDGVLGYLSFASLLKTPVTSLVQIRTYDFMVRHHDISYCYSAALYLELRDRSGQAGPALICAPDFSRRNEIVPLAYSKREAELICQMTGGKLLSGPDCTVEAFRQSLTDAKYNVLHLATHGSADDASGDLSFLMFSSEGDDAGMLYARDLYDMDLPMNLVYLSACETATGELKRGEGIISLARSFFYAGAQSLVTTLWRVEDSRAAVLSTDFYKGMKSGLRKDQALATAQRKYLNGLDLVDKLNAHPVYWSALIAIGNMNPVQFKAARRSPTWLILGSLGVLALLGLLTWQRLKQ
jgi:CHAT domain-containing protein